MRQSLETLGRLGKLLEEEFEFPVGLGTECLTRSRTQAPMGTRRERNTNPSKDPSGDPISPSPENLLRPSSKRRRRRLPKSSASQVISEDNQTRQEEERQNANHHTVECQWNRGRREKGRNTQIRREEGERTVSPGDKLEEGPGHPRLRRMGSSRTSRPTRNAGRAKAWLWRSTNPREERCDVRV